MTIAGKDEDEISKNSNKIGTKKSTDFNYTVSEGSIVVLDAHEFINDKEIDTIKDYSWIQTGGVPAVDINNENTYSFSFTAPYIKGDDVNTTLSFQLTTTDNRGKATTHNANVITLLTLMG
jgi:hypothetical protein